MKSIFAKFGAGAVMGGLVAIIVVALSWNTISGKKATAAAEAQTPAQPTEQEVSQGGLLTGKVQERLESGGYVYLRIEQGAESVWAAVPGASAKVGDVAQVRAQALMPSFQSRTLNRTFDNIWFGTIEGEAQTSQHGAGPLAPGQVEVPQGHPPMTADTQAAMANEDPSESVTGKVLEVKDVPSYTYLRLAIDSGETWAAVPTAKVEPGATVTVAHATAMLGFESKTLNKKFDKILFGTLKN